MTSKEKGNLGLIKIIARFIELGYEVFTEVGDNSDIDLIVVNESQLLKLQAKTTEKVKNGAMVWELVKSRMNSKGYYKSFYDKKIDGFALYCLENDYVGFISLDDVSNKYAISFRLDKTKNNQIKKVKFAEDYKI